MKIAYAFRRNIFHPFTGGASRTQLPERKTLERYLGTVKDIGFDGLELGMDSWAQDVDESAASETRKVLEDAGLPCVVVRAGGGFDNPSVATQNKKKLHKAIAVAGWMGAEIVNTAIVTPPKTNVDSGSVNGTPIPDPSSKSASEQDFERAASVLRDAGAVAGSAGLNITIEVHQRSIADNSWSALHLLDLAGSPYVHANPDLGNILWNYDEPEETMEEAITALAPRSKYWHCKNLHRVHVPEIERSYFVRVPLSDGDIDYRFAISAMADAGYDGYLAVEGGTAGDQLHQDRQSVEYVKGVLASP